MPDLRRTRKRITISLAILLGVDVLAVVALFSPLVGSAESRREELNQLWSDLRTKTRQVEPLANLDQKVKLANGQIKDFYKVRFPAQDSQIATQFGKVATANGITIEQAQYRVKDESVDGLYPVEIEAHLSGNYIALARFINALERDDMLFIISSIELGGEQNGIKLQMKVVTYLKAGA